MVSLADSRVTREMGLCKSVRDFLMAVRCEDPPTVGGTISWAGTWTVYVEKGS